MKFKGRIEAKKDIQLYYYGKDVLRLPPGTIVKVIPANNYHFANLGDTIIRLEDPKRPFRTIVTAGREYSPYGAIWEDGIGEYGFQLLFGRSEQDYKDGKF